jgi:hypothetical protein
MLDGIIILLEVWLMMSLSQVNYTFYHGIAKAGCPPARMPGGGYYSPQV